VQTARWWVADMPFLTYQVSPEQATRNATRLFQEGGAAAVKLEGGRAIADTVRKAHRGLGLPVMGHLGLTSSARASPWRNAPAGP